MDLSTVIIPDGMDPANLPKIKAALQIITQLRKQVDLADRAGISTGTSRADLDAQEAKLKTILQVYFPGQ